MKDCPCCKDHKPTKLDGSLYEKGAYCGICDHTILREESKK